MSSMRSIFILALLSAPGGVAAENEATQVSPQLRQRAEDLAGAASKRFTDLLDGRQRTAQVAPQTPATENSGTFAPVWDWLARSAQAYDDVVITKMKEKDGWTVIVQRNDKAPPPAAQTLPRLRKLRSRSANCTAGAASSKSCATGWRVPTVPTAPRSSSRC